MLRPSKFLGPELASDKMCFYTTKKKRKVESDLFSTRHERNIMNTLSSLGWILNTHFKLI